MLLYIYLLAGCKQGRTGNGLNLFMMKVLGGWDDITESVGCGAVIAPSSSFN